jgi:glycosyltransferase involved in cell wall biosynthesis
VHLAIDASRVTAARVTGTERYAREMIAALLPLAVRHRVTLYFRDIPPAGLFPDYPHVTQRVIPFARVWTHVRLAWQVLRDRPDLLWVPAHALPFAFPGRAAVTVHDLGYRLFPEAHPPRQRAYLDLTTRTSAARASIVLADSEATRADLGRFYGTPAGKIRVVYPGFSAPPVGDSAAIRAKYGLPEHYFLYLGTLQPRKNIARLVQAFARWQAAHPGDETALVLAGAQGWLFDPAWTAGVPRVLLPGFVDDADKGALYAGALAFVFPSLYEGFGFPVLEAMSCGAPVLCSGTSSLPEVAGDAALLVDPPDVDAIAAGMARLSDDAALRTAMAAKGRAQAATFRWEEAAARALAAFEEVAR